MADRESFTTNRVAGYQCTAGKTQTIYWDAKTPGLGLRVTKAGTKSYIFETRLHGKTVRLTIGDVRTWSVGQAQAEATSIKSMTDRGIDPRQVIADQRASAVAAELERRRSDVTLGDAWSVYVAARRSRWSEWHIRDHERVTHLGGAKKLRGAGLTEAGPLASLLSSRLSELSGKHIGEWLAKESAIRPTQASLAFRLLSVFVNWCESHAEFAGLVPAGACKSQQVRDELPPRNAKEGDCLQKEQLAAWFGAVLGMTNAIQSAYLQILLLTGARRRELGSLRWDDVDFRWLSLTIRDKVEGERTIPLSPYVAGLLNTLPRRNEWVFSSESSRNGQLVEPTSGHKRALLAAGLPDLTLHGLRRSFGSLAEWTEVPTGIVAQIMGHKPSAIAEKHYRRRPLDLLRMWHCKIEAWILEQAGIPVVPVA